MSKRACSRFHHKGLIWWYCFHFTAKAFYFGCAAELFRVICDCIKLNARFFRNVLLLKRRLQRCQIRRNSKQMGFSGMRHKFSKKTWFYNQNHTKWNINVKESFPTFLICNVKSMEQHLLLRYVPLDAITNTGKIGTDQFRDFSRRTTVRPTQQ